LGEKSCQSFMKNICNIVGIDIKNRSITNHSGRSTSITALFRKGVPMVTTMALTGHKSEASYQENLSSTASELSNKVLNDTVKNWNSVTRPFHTPLKNASEEGSDGTVVIKNYYINADNVTIN
ncbi:4724_t:CDS:2, partial [Racocetra persica]